MSVASEFDIQRQLITNAYNKLDDLGIDLTNIDKNIDNIAEMLDTVYEEYPKITGTGTEVTLDGTKIGKLGLDVKGNSTQDGTPTPTNEVPIYSAGDDIQLFDKTTATIGSYVKASNGKLEQYNNTIFATDYIGINQNETYYWNDNSLRPNQGAFYDTNKNYISGIASPSTHYFTTPANAKYVRLTGATEIIDTLKLQKGSTPSSYSPYNMGTISEKIVNKNLINFTIDNKVPSVTNGELVDKNGATSTDFIPINVINNFILSWNFTAGTNLYTLFYGENYSYLGYNQKTATSGTYNPSGNANWSNTKYVKFRVDNKSVLGECQFEINTTATTYTAHAEQTYTIPVQQPMKSLKTVPDEFIQDTNGNYFERHNISTIIYTGASSEAWQYYQGIVFIDNSNIKAYSENGGMLLTNYFTPPACYIAHTTRQRLHINLTNAGLSDITSVSAWKTWLSTHNLVFQFELATPVDLPCTAEQISILENLPKSYNEQTNIYSLDVIPAYVEAKALKGE